MAAPTKPTKTVGDYNPDTETGELLDAIEGKEVTIKGVMFDSRRGRNGEYTLSIIELEDGTLFHTGGPVVAERLGNVPDSEYPIRATFTREKSRSNPGQTYWTVS